MGGLCYVNLLRTWLCIGVIKKCSGFPLLTTLHGIEMDTYPSAREGGRERALERDLLQLTHAPHTSKQKKYSISQTSYPN
jgi:hypothetical protein